VVMEGQHELAEAMNQQLVDFTEYPVGNRLHGDRIAELQREGNEKAPGGPGARCSIKDSVDDAVQRFSFQIQKIVYVLLCICTKPDLNVGQDQLPVLKICKIGDLFQNLVPLDIELDLNEYFAGLVGLIPVHAAPPEARARSWG